jgi:hypothetical protein
MTTVCRKTYWKPMSVRALIVTVLLSAAALIRAEK